MVRIGWMSDSHVWPVNQDVQPSGGPERPGAGDRLTEDIKSLFRDYNIVNLYFNGDAVMQTDAFTESGYAHSAPQYYEHFWNLVDNSGFGNRVVCTPGNHDIPLQYFTQSDDRAHLTYKKTYEGVTLLMMNTAAPGWVSGSPEAGYGWNVGYVPFTDLKWMEKQLSKANDEDAKVVFFHHHAWPTPGDPRAAVPEGTETINNPYWVCQNYQSIHEILSSHDKVIVPQGHTNQATSEGSSNVDGVEYLYKKHYYKGKDDSVTTYAYIDVNSSSCRVTSIDHNTGKENILLNKKL